MYSHLHFHKLQDLMIKINSFMTKVCIILLKRLRILLNPSVLKSAKPPQTDACISILQIRISTNLIQDVLK